MREAVAAPPAEATFLPENPAMIKHTTPYGISTRVSLSYDEAVTRTRDALAGEGFGVLSEIDVAATFKKKLGVDFRPYVILGACNPPLAYKALSQERDLGLLLPCNVIVYADDEPGTSVVAVMDPIPALQLTRNEELTPVAKEVRARLERVLEAVNDSVTAGL
jgi:uncharacterized protein (DUF302 family)